ncbi:MAG: cysteine--tRNA ligase [Clostridia bacterium]|nr:cysteine--tRNA ligase [Erysipelotrichia bacterium]NCC87274.1 cysteine--tRNA ligase [Clostridia bacterium]
MHLYNSLHNKLEEFKPMKAKEVSMYVCGPTVYNYPHIGNARPIIVFDTFKKMFEASGFKVKYVSNFTDVDDKIINKAKEEGVDEKVISERYIQVYNEDRKRLHADMPDATPRVTETMDEIIAFIDDLVEMGYAYEIDGDVYFRVSKVEDYGKLSKQRIDDLMVGARIDENSKKENPLDFTLWKKTEEGIKWDTKWSSGRPGWHTECVVMINKEFHSPLIDIHGGGMDLKFPHHENEMAQGCAHSHCNVANYWLHNGMLNIDGVKMSKSLGNVLWAKDFVEAYGENVVRWLMLSTHYRSPLNINDETIQNAKSELEKITHSLRQSYVKMELGDYADKADVNEELFAPFLEAMQDDLNTPNAFKALFDLNKMLNASLRVKEIDYAKIAMITVTMEKMLYVLGIHINKVTLDQDDKETFKAWQIAIQAKDFVKADELRACLVKKGLL